MKILFLNNFFYHRGGAEGVLLDEIRLLEEAGHEVAVFSRKHESNLSAVFEKSFPPGIQTDSLKLSLKAFGTAKELVYSNRTRLGLRQVIGEFQPDICHAHNIYGRLSTSVLDELSDQKIPTVMTLHDCKLICPSYLMLNRGKVCEKCQGKNFHHAILTKCHKNSYVASFIYAFESWFNLFFDKYGMIKSFITPSRFLLNKCVEFGWKKEKFFHVPNFAENSDSVSFRKPGDYFLFFGRLSREKGILTLVKAMRNFSDHVPLVVVGDGPLRSEIENEVTRNQLNVQFTGYLRGQSLKEKISGAKAVFVPSEGYENAPLAILESFAFGKPVIGSRIGGIPEMIEESENGFLFEAGNVADLRSRIATLMNLSDKKLIEMGKEAQRTVQEKFSPELHFEKLMAVYKKVVEEPCI